MMSNFPVHYLNVYQRLKTGTAFIRRFPIFNYQHTITNQGWFDTASCDIAVRSQGEGMGILNTYLGCFIAVYVDNAAAPVWEGIINRVTFNAGVASYTISLDEMANRVSVVYTGAANAAAETAVADNIASMVIYGLKQGQIEFGVDKSAGTQKTLLRDTMLAQLAFPQASISQAQGQSNLVHLECIGIYHTLRWEKLFSVLLGTTNTFTTDIVAGYLPFLQNGNSFFDNTDFTQIATNAGTNPTQQRAKSIWDHFAELAAAGDGTNYWIIGITPTNRNTGKRVLYYRQANYAIEYSAFQSDGLIIRNAFGKKVPPWMVVPDRVIRIKDQLVGIGGSIQTDPTTTYIQSIQYDANTQRVQWFGADNTTARAAFQLTKSFKPLGTNFGAPTRELAT